MALILVEAESLETCVTKAQGGAAALKSAEGRGHAALGPWTASRLHRCPSLSPTAHEERWRKWLGEGGVTVWGAVFCAVSVHSEREH